MTERKAVHYGPVELIPGIPCEAYVLDNGAAVMSERGVAKLLGMKHASLQSVAVNSVKVVAENSPHKGRDITVYDSSFIESMIRGYSLGLANDTLRPNQKHVGKRCVILQSALARTAIEVAIREACGLPANIQATAQKTYTDIVELMRESGLKCSVNDEIAIKTDITNFLDIPLNSHLSKHRSEIKPIQLNRTTIRAIGSTAPRMNGYNVKDVGTIALGMDSVIGIDLKEKMPPSTIIPK